MSQVLDGLLRRYVKGIQKEQLKIGIWKGQSSSLPSPPLYSSTGLPNRAQTGGCPNRDCPVTAALVFEFLWLRAVLHVHYFGLSTALHCEMIVCTVS